MADTDAFIHPSELAGVPVPDHDGFPVTECNGSITGLNGGFAETARLDRIHVPVGSRVIALVVMTATSHEYDRVTEGTGPDRVALDEFRETTVYKGESVQLIDPEAVNDIVAKHQERVAKARSDAAQAAREAKGEFTLPLPSTYEEATITPINGEPDDDGYADSEKDPSIADDPEAAE